MTIVVECDCKKAYKVPAKYANKKMRCRACGDVLTVPAVEGATEGPAERVRTGGKKKRPVLKRRPARRRGSRSPLSDTVDREAPAEEEPSDGTKKSSRPKFTRQGKLNLIIYGSCAAFILIASIVGLILKHVSDTEADRNAFFEKVETKYGFALGCKKAGTYQQALPAYEELLEIIEQNTRFSLSSNPKLAEIPDKARKERDMVSRLVELIRLPKGSPAQLAGYAKEARSDDPDVRYFVVLQLKRVEGEEATDILCRLARDRDPKVSERAKLTMFDRGGKASLPFIMELIEEGNKDIQTMGVTKLLEMEEPAVVPYLLKIMEKYKRSSSVVSYCFKRFKHFKDPRVVDTLKRFIREDDRDYLTIEAREALDVIEGNAGYGDR